MLSLVHKISCFESNLNVESMGHQANKNTCLDSSGIGVLLLPKTLKIYLRESSHEHYVGPHWCDPLGFKKILM